MNAGGKSNNFKKKKTKEATGCPPLVAVDTDTDTEMEPPFTNLNPSK